MGGAGQTSDPGFAVYVHWPFCQAKCPYCDFNSHVRHGGVDQVPYAEALKTELRWFSQRTGERTVRSIFFGGGTPSLMEPATVDAVLSEIRSLWPVAPEVEISLEANPSSVEAERFAGYAAAGVNRVSLGIQALNDADLRALGRLHDTAQARAAIGIARETFARVSIDLIYARPGQSEEAWADELDEALELGIGHMSLYQLTIEPGTPFAARHAAGTLVVPGADAAAALYELTQVRMTAAGLAAYEISNHARTGEQCAHNLVYWRYGEYAGVGPGAHGRVSIRGARHALETEKKPEAWCERVRLAGNGFTSIARLEAGEMADECLLMGLRLSEGLDTTYLGELTGYALDPSTLAQLENDGLIRLSRDRVIATDAGRPLLNGLITELSHGLRALASV